jgi:predicted PurR-regulated permease PerM
MVRAVTTELRSCGGVPVSPPRHGLSKLLNLLLVSLSFTPAQRTSSEILESLLRIATLKLLLLAFMAVVALGFVMIHASVLLIPLTLAWFVTRLFAPFVKHLTHYRIPAPLTAACIVFLLVAGLFSLINFTIEPASRWIEELPASLRILRTKLAHSEGPLSNLQEVTKEVQELTSITADAGQSLSVPKVEVVEPQGGMLRSLLMHDLPELTAMFLMTMALTYFMLATTDQLVRVSVKAVTSLRTRRRIVLLSREINAQMAHYLQTISLINLSLALVVAFALWLIDVPNPFLWGLLAGLLNFAPYVGPTIMACVLLLVGVTSSDGLQEALLVPGVFIVITTLEGQLITPSVIGRQLALSPMVVFLAVMLLTWLWGPVGALLASPLVAAGRILWKSAMQTRPIASIEKGLIQE